MSPEKQNQTIAEACGVAPGIVTWCCWSPDRETTCMSADTREECQAWLDRLPEGSWAKGYSVGPLLRYPNYPEDLNAMNVAESGLTEKERARMRGELALLVTGHKRPSAWRADPGRIPLGEMVHASAAKRAEAFLRTIGKWEGGTDGK